MPPKRNSATGASPSPKAKRPYSRTAATSLGKTVIKRDGDGTRDRHFKFCHVCYRGLSGEPRDTHKLPCGHWQCTICIIKSVDASFVKDPFQPAVSGCYHAQPLSVQFVTGIIHANDRRRYKRRMDRFELDSNAGEVSEDELRQTTQSYLEGRDEAGVKFEISGSSDDETENEAQDPPASTRECLVCMDGFHQDSMTELACGHWYCEECIKRGIHSALETRPFVSAKCCGLDMVVDSNSKLLTSVLGAKDREAYTEKMEEAADGDKVYCYDGDCGAFILPGCKETDADIGVCLECRGWTCLRCHGKADGQKCCAEAAERKKKADEEGNEVKFRDEARKHGWRTCPSCGAMVEKTSGCNSMRCTCGTNFCYRCGATPYYGSPHVEGCAR